MICEERSRRAERDLIYLATCAVVGEEADPGKIADIDDVFDLASRHMLTAIVAMTLERVGVRHARLSQALAVALRKAFLFDDALKQVKSGLESENIWHMPLKGAELKRYYPHPAMREVADCDVLFDATRADDARRVMEGLGFTAKRLGAGIHDCYFKEPCLNFEMHRELFGSYSDKKKYDYYQNVYDRLLSDGCVKRFSPGDFYLYLIAHQHKHYVGGGSGLRSFLDIFVYLRKEQLDMTYVAREADKLGLANFEANVRSFAFRLFEGGELGVDDRKTLSYVLSSGAYGTFEHRVENKTQGKKWGKIRYMAERFAVPVSSKNPRYKCYSAWYPFFYRHKVLLPLLPFYRIFRSVKEGRFIDEAKAVIAAKRS